jgi:hypothetical protein
MNNLAIIICNEPRVFDQLEEAVAALGFREEACRDAVWRGVRVLYVRTE